MENLNLLQDNIGMLLPSFFASYRTPNDGQCKLNICVSNVFLCSIGWLPLWESAIILQTTNTENNLSSSKNNWRSSLLRNHWYSVFKANYNSKNYGNMNQHTMFPVNVCNNELNRTYHRTFFYSHCWVLRRVMYLVRWGFRVRVSWVLQISLSYLLPSSGRGFDHNELCYEKIGFDFSSRSR